MGRLMSRKRKGSTIKFVDDGKGGKHFVAADTSGQSRMRAERVNLALAEWVTSGSRISAFVRAGYTPNLANNAANRICKRHPGVVEEVQRRRVALRERVELNQEAIIFELARLGFSRADRAITWKDGQAVLADSDAIDDDTLAAIQEVSVDGDGKMKLKFYDKKSALVDLGKFLGMAQPGDVGALLAAVRGEAIEDKTPKMDKRELARRAALLIRNGALAAPRK